MGISATTTTMASLRISVLLLLLSVSYAHRRGQEYTYLSMFSKGQPKEAVKGEDDLGSLYQQLSIKGQHPSVKVSVMNEGTERVDAVGSDGDDMDIGKDEDNDMEGGLVGGVGGVVRMQTGEKGEQKDDEKKEEDKDEDKEEDKDEENNEKEKEEEEAEKKKRKKRRRKSNETHSSSTVRFETTEAMEKIAARHGENVQRLQMMLFKLIEQYKVQSLADIPCRAHSHWMPSFLSHIQQTHPHFVYYCVDTNREILESLKASFPSLDLTSKFVLRRFWSEGIPRADMVFSWGGLDNMQPEHVRMYLHRLSRTTRHKLIAVGSHPGVDGEEVRKFSMGGKPVNVRRKPYYLKKPMRIIGELGADGNDKQLYIYRAVDMRSNKKKRQSE